MMMDLDPPQDEDTEMSNSDVHNIILSYLVHNSFKDTAESFIASTGMKKPAGYCLDDMEKRKRICNFIIEGKVLKAIEQTEQLAPDILEKNMDLHFDLLGLHFVELVSSRKSNEALKFAQAKLAPFMKAQSFLQKLEDFLSLLAFDEPEKSPMFHLLSLEHRQHVADSLNGAILAHENQPRYSVLERLIQQTTMVRQCLSEDPASKEGSQAFSFKDFIKKKSL
ncbi:unnamed protein product [Cuscuta campestris]|uniref:CTLH domain-containing protein n=2 Tax=Cuscuta sect. Cleistogrammica TaxID=1824901 RepID=A0A484KME6_9ASTE|nr:hypothetical protein DM860_006786 [Cuscuta australis]VFQ63236.1 unnamed protein product [Cuscuta campestris]